MQDNTLFLGDNIIHIHTYICMYIKTNTNYLTCRKRLIITKYMISSFQNNFGIFVQYTYINIKKKLLFLAFFILKIQYKIGQSKFSDSTMSVQYQCLLLFFFFLF